MLLPLQLLHEIVTLPTCSDFRLLQVLLRALPVLVNHEQPAAQLAFPLLQDPKLLLCHEPGLPLCLEVGPLLVPLPPHGGLQCLQAALRLAPVLLFLPQALGKLVYLPPRRGLRLLQVCLCLLQARHELPVLVVGAALQGLNLLLCALPRLLLNLELRLGPVLQPLPPLLLAPRPLLRASGPPFGRCSRGSGRGQLRSQPIQLRLQLVLPPLHAGHFDVVHRVELLSLVLHHPLCLRQLTLEGLAGALAPPSLQGRGRWSVTSVQRVVGRLACGLPLEDPRPLRLLGARAPPPPPADVGSQALLRQIL